MHQRGTCWQRRQRPLPPRTTLLAICRAFHAHEALGLLGEALQVDRTDGVSAEFADWRFNLRSSNTEPVVRLNVESRADAALMRQKTAEILAVLDGQA